MSLHPQEPPSVPEETKRVARAAFPKGSLCMHIADELGSIYTDDQFTALFPRRGKHAEAPGRLALATVLQFLEGLSDRQAADVVRGRIDWKYALGLLLIDPGFDHTVLSEFRSRLIEGGAERLSPSQIGGKAVAFRFPERWAAVTNELVEVAVEDPCSGLKQQMSAARRPSHRLTPVKAFVHDLVDRGLHEASGDAFIGADRGITPPSPAAALRWGPAQHVAQT